VIHGRQQHLKALLIRQNGNEDHLLAWPEPRPDGQFANDALSRLNGLPGAVSCP
jgi:hypothetical protein